MTGFSQAMRGEARTLALRGTVTYPGGGFYILDGSDVASFSISEGNEGGILPGDVLSAGCQLVLENADGRWELNGAARNGEPLAGASFFLELGVLADGDFLYSSLGTFVCDAVSADENGATVSLTLYDTVYSRTAGAFEDSLGYPRTLSEIWAQLCGRAGYAFSGSVPGGDRIVDWPPAWGEISVRAAMGFVAAVCGCFVRVDRAGELRLVPLVSTEAATAVPPETYLSRKKLDATFGPVNALKVTTVNDREEDDAEPYDISIGPEGAAEECILQVTGNPLFVTGGAHTHALAEGMFSALDGLSYAACRFVWRGDPMLLPGAKLSVVGVGGEVTQCALSRQTLKFDGGFSAECVSGTPDVAVSAKEITPAGGVKAGQIIGVVRGANIAASSITASKIAASAVEADRIAAGAVTAGKIAADAVTAGAIEAGAVTAIKIAAQAVETGKIAAGAVVAEKIAAGAVTAQKISAGAVEADKIAASAVTADKIAAGAITAQQIAAGTISADRCVTGMIAAGTGLIAAGAIGSAQIADASITDAKIVGLTASKITAGTINGSEINVTNLNADNIVAGTINGQRIPVLGADKITDGAISGVKIETGAVTTTKLSDSAVTADKIVGGAVTADKLAAASVTTNALAANAVTAAKIDVADLFAAAATVGALKTAVISNIGIGGNNLWRNSAFEFGADGWNVLDWSPTGTGKNWWIIEKGGAAWVPTEANVLQIQATNETGQYGAAQHIPGLTKGVDYTLSFFARQANMAGKVHLIIYNADGSWAILVSEVIDVTAGGDVTSLSGYTRVTRTFNTGVYNNVYIGVYGAEWTTDCTLWLTRFQLEQGEMPTDWTPSRQEMNVGSTLMLSESRAVFRTPEFLVEIPGAEDGETKMRIDGDGAYFPQAESPTLAPRHSGGVYAVGAGQDYESLADAFDGVKSAVLKSDLVLKLCRDDAGGALRGVAGGRRVILSGANLANYWATPNVASGVTAGVLGTYDGIRVTATDAGTYKNALYDLGRVTDLGIRGLPINLRLNISAASGTPDAVAMVYLMNPDYSYEYQTLGGLNSGGNGQTLVMSIPEGAAWDAHLVLRLFVSAAVSVTAGTAADFRQLSVEIGAANSGSLAHAPTVSNLLIENNQARAHLVRLTSPGQMKIANTAAFITRCTINGYGGVGLFAEMAKIRMAENDGACQYAVIAEESLVYVTGKAPSGGYIGTAGWIDTTTAQIGTATPTAPTTQTAVLTANATGTYTIYWWSSDRSVRQGYTESNGRIRGGMWWDMTAIPSGASVSAMRLTLKRMAGYGKGDDVIIKAYGTASDPRSGQPALSSAGYVLGTIGDGKTKTFDFPAALVTGLAVGTYKGIVLYADDTSVLSGKTYSTNYARMEGTDGTAPKLAVTYTT